MPIVKIIIGSTRPSRFGIQPAKWITELSREHSNATFELVDLAELNLPPLDEPQPAITGIYTKDHTKKWSKIIAEADGFVFVTGEYNFSIPAALKNAIDFLTAEWRYKPVAFVSYGAGAGGALAVSHLRSSIANVGMFDLRDHIAFVNYWTQLDEKGQLQPQKEHIATAHTLLDNIAFWSGYLKGAREQLTTKKS